MHTITFTADGSAKTLWTDALPLAELGTLEVNRASTIEFNPIKQKWEVRLIRHPHLPPSEPPVFSHKSRSRCITWEHKHFNQ